jgi:hypothetical protein
LKATLQAAVAAYGAKAKSKLNNFAAKGQPEDQIRAPFENLLGQIAELCGFPQGTVAPVGESSVGDLKTRPDYAVSVHNALAGFIELKAPGKGADPRKYKDPHDKAQWEKLRSLPNLIYSDGNAFSLWQDGELVGPVITLTGDIETSGTKLQTPVGLLTLFENFLNWKPVPPRSAKELAQSTARLCRLLREEVTEQLALKSVALTDLATDWRKLLFPDATDERFADGYAQAVTFGLLMARAKNIKLSAGLQQVATTLSQTSSLIGAALRLLTDSAENQATLKTSLGTPSQRVIVTVGGISREVPRVQSSGLAPGVASRTLGEDFPEKVSGLTPTRLHVDAQAGSSRRISRLDASRLLGKQHLRSGVVARLASW